MGGRYGPPPQQRVGSGLGPAGRGLTGGHFGIKKTLQRLRHRFYWEGMRHDVQEWCKACHVCCAKKGPQRKPQAPLQIYRVGAPMERIAVDITGPLPVTESGNRYILVAMDYFTKWPEAYAIPNQEATTVARKLVDEFFTRFGIPNELHSDQGRNFESAVFQECCNLMGIRKTRTTALHPQSDGMVERFNSTLGQQLAKFCRNNQAAWDEKLPMLVMAYRSAEHEATGYTPARVMSGRELRLPTHVTTGVPPEDDESRTMPEYVDKMKRNLVEVHHHVRKNLEIAAGTMKLRFDAKASRGLLEPGDKVWLYNPRRRKGVCPKLSSDWEGPYMIVNRLSDVIYRIKGEGRSKPKVVHFNRLWKMRDPAKFTWTRDPTDAAGDPTSSASVDSDHDGAQMVSDDDDDTDPEVGVGDRGDIPAVVCAAIPATDAATGEVQTEEEAVEPAGVLAVPTSSGNMNHSNQRPIRTRRAPPWHVDFVLDV